MGLCLVLPVFALHRIVSLFLHLRNDSKVSTLYIPINSLSFSTLIYLFFILFTFYLWKKTWISELRSRVRKHIILYSHWFYHANSYSILFFLFSLYFIHRYILCKNIMFQCTFMHLIIIPIVNLQVLIKMSIYLWWPSPLIVKLNQ